MLLITHPDCLNHARPGHPERPERLASVLEMLDQSGLGAEVQQSLANEISDADLRLVHPESYIRQIAAAERPGEIVSLDPDTFMSGGSNRAARLAAGAVAEATRRVLDGEVGRAFCAVRPPGHHAELAEAFGFCLYNSVAAGARLALERDDINRVAVLDFDVHHCNGTVDIFKDDPRVLVCSSFQDDYYPHRFLDFENSHIINTPLDAGSGSREFRQQVEQSWLPALEQHQPQFILVSAGFDAHKLDPLAQINLDEADFVWITDLICDAARRYAAGRIVSTLEGGYHLEALASSARVHIEQLLSHE